MSGRNVVVIGGGVIGVSAAYYLALDGWEVTLLEKGEICAGSSYGNAGLIVPSHLVPLAAPGVWWQGVKWMLNSESPFYIKPRAEPRARPVALALPRRVHTGSRAARHAAPPAAERGEPRALSRVRREGARLRVPPGRLDDGVLHARGPGPWPRRSQAPPRGRGDRRGPGRRERRGRPSRPWGPASSARSTVERTLCSCPTASSRGWRSSPNPRACAYEPAPRRSASGRGQPRHGGRDDARGVLCRHRRPGGGRLVTGRGARPRAPRADPARQGV